MVGNLSRILLAVITHRDEWHLNYALTLFIRYGAPCERRLAGWDLPVHLFFVIILSSIISLFLYEVAYMLISYEAFHNYQLLGLAGEF